MKIISKEFEVEDLTKHIKNCERCQNDFQNLIENFVKNNPYGSVALNIFKLLKQNK